MEDRFDEEWALAYKLLGKKGVIERLDVTAKLRELTSKSATESKVNIEDLKRLAEEMVYTDLRPDVTVRDALASTEKKGFKTDMSTVIMEMATPDEYDIFHRAIERYHKPIKNPKRDFLKEMSYNQAMEFIIEMALRNPGKYGELSKTRDELFRHMIKQGHIKMEHIYCTSNSVLQGKYFFNNPDINTHTKEDVLRCLDRATAYPSEIGDNSTLYLHPLLPITHELYPLGISHMLRLKVTEFDVEGPLIDEELGGVKYIHRPRTLEVNPGLVRVLFNLFTSSSLYPRMKDRRVAVNRAIFYYFHLPNFNVEVAKQLLQYSKELHPSGHSLLLKAVVELLLKLPAYDELYEIMEFILKKYRKDLKLEDYRKLLVDDTIRGNNVQHNKDKPLLIYKYKHLFLMSGLSGGTRLEVSFPYYHLDLVLAYEVYRTKGRKFLEEQDPRAAETVRRVVSQVSSTNRGESDVQILLDINADLSFLSCERFFPYEVCYIGGIKMPRGGNKSLGWSSSTFSDRERMLPIVFF